MNDFHMKISWFTVYADAVIASKNGTTLHTALSYIYVSILVQKLCLLFIVNTTVGHNVL